MKISRLWAIAGIPLLVVACAPADDDTALDDTALSDTAMAPATAPMDTGMMGMDTGMAGMEATVSLEDVEDSGVTGEAMFTVMGDSETQVMVEIMGTAGNTTHQGHIHTGTCDNLGPIVVELEEITTDAEGTGSSTSTADVPLTTVMNGEHLVAYHVAGGDPGPHVTCAEIPMQGM